MEILVHIRTLLSVYAVILPCLYLGIHKSNKFCAFVIFNKAACAQLVFFYP